MSINNTTDVQVTGRASGNTATDIVIPDTVVDSGTTYGVTTIGNDAFRTNALTSVIISGSVTTIGQYAFQFIDLTSAAFEGNFGDFNPTMFFDNPNLAAITYCDVTTGWPQGFNNGSTIIVTEPVNCSPAPDAPIIDSIAAGNGEAIITFTPGADNGSPITSYTATCTDGSADYTGNSSTSRITVTRLNNGVSYVCVVSATNDAGTSQGSEASTVTPAGDVDGDGVNDLLENCVSIADPGSEDRGA